MNTKWRLLVLVLGAVIIVACTRHEIQVAPVEVKPIHITIDVNVRVDKALDDFFEDLDESSESQRPQSRFRSGPREMTQIAV
jgi:hypothetical protein